MSSAPQGPGAPAPSDPRPSASAEDGSSGRRSGGPQGTALLALGLEAVAMLAMDGPLWMTLAALVAAVAGGVLAIVALARLGRTPGRGMVIVMSVLALIAAVMNVVGGGVRLVFWDQVSAYQTCMSESVTLSGQASCQTQLQDGLLSTLLGEPRP